GQIAAPRNRQYGPIEVTVRNDWLPLPVHAAVSRPTTPVAPGRLVSLTTLHAAALHGPLRSSRVIGKVLGHCRVEAKIGEGGMGVVYRAYDELLHRDVALKVVNKGSRLDPSTSQSLLQEARASSSLSHPNICTIHEVGETDGELYIVMELVEGKSLRELSGEAGLPAESVLRYGVQIAAALS